MQRKKEGSWWLWVPFLLMLATLFWMILARRKRQPRQNRPAVSPPTPHITLPPEEDAPPLADDLTVIRGIGPKTAGVLAQAGIRTFAQQRRYDLVWAPDIQPAGLSYACPMPIRKTGLLRRKSGWGRNRNLKPDEKRGTVRSSSVIAGRAF